MKVLSKTVSFQEVRREYDGLYRTDIIKDEDRAYRWFAQKVVGRLPRGARFLDVACGGGYFLREVATLGDARLFGTDLSGAALELTSHNSPMSLLAQTTGEQLPFRSGAFDYASCLGSLEHFLDPLAALQELHRVLAPTGILLVMVPNLFWYKDILSVVARGSRLTRNQSHETFAVEAEWRELLKQGGFDIFRTLKYNGVSRNPAKQFLKDLLVPRVFCYHFIFLCRP